MNSNNISHSARIIEIAPDFTSVEIISQAACSSCHAKQLCGMGESEIKIIQIPTRATDNYKVGDEVELVLKASLGHKAVWLAYVLPMIVLIGVLLGLSLAGLGELVCGLGAIAAVIIYYVILRLLRDKIAEEYVFNIKR